MSGLRLGNGVGRCLRLVALIRHPAEAHDQPEQTGCREPHSHAGIAPSPLAQSFPHRPFPRELERAVAEWRSMSVFSSLAD